MTVFINDQLLFNAQNLGIQDLDNISFDANLTNQGGNGEAARIDNLCLDACSPTPIPNACTNSSDLYCEDFEQCNDGDVVNDKDNWTDSFFAGKLFVDSENDNMFINVGNDGMDEAGAVFELPLHAGPDDIEILSFNAWIPEEGGLSTLYDATNGQTMFIDFTDDLVYGPRVNIGITNIFYTYDPITGDSYVSAPFNTSEWFEVELQLNRSNNNLDISFRLPRRVLPKCVRLRYGCKQGRCKGLPCCGGIRPITPLNLPACPTGYQPCGNRPPHSLRHFRPRAAATRA